MTPAGECGKAPQRGRYCAKVGRAIEAETGFHTEITEATEIREEISNR